MIRKTTLIFALAIITQFGFSQTFNKAGLDNYFLSLEAGGNPNSKKNPDKWFMGSVAISQNGKIIYSRQMGFTDVVKKTKSNANTRYEIASVTKIFTAVLVFKAIEEGKLKLSDKLSAYFPSIKNSEKITIGLLLSHRSGIRDYLNEEEDIEWSIEPKTEQELIEIIKKGKSNFEPDAEARYSNSNFLLLSYILEKIYKLDYARLINEKITTPLGLKNTYMGKGIDINKNECYPHTFNERWIKEPSVIDPSVLYGAGGIVSNPIDLVQFEDALFSGKLVSPQSLEQMKTIKDGFGMGLVPFPFNDKMGYGHGGFIDEFTSCLHHFEEGNVTIAITANGVNYDFHEIRMTLLAAMYNLPIKAPYKKQLAKIPNTDCTTALEIEDSIVGPCNISSDHGKYVESVYPSKCPSCNEDNSAWFKFTIDRDTILTFDLVPIDSQDDYDFTLFKCPDTGCVFINGRSNLKKIRFCLTNNRFNGGKTGMSRYSTLDTIWPGLDNGPAYTTAVNVKAGETYYLMITYAQWYIQRALIPQGFKLYFYNLLPRKRAKILNNVFFETGKSVLKPESFIELNKLVALLKLQMMTIEIRGHTDNAGDAKKNKVLSEERAKAVMDYLILKGINKNRLLHKGLGSSKPIADNSTEAGRIKNRRVDFIVLLQGW